MASTLAHILLKPPEKSKDFVPPHRHLFLVNWQGVSASISTNAKKTPHPPKKPP